MAPKIASTAPPAKEGKEKPAEDGKDEKGEKSKVQKIIERAKRFFKTPLGLYLIVMFDAILLAITITFIILGMKEWNRTANLRDAMRMVRNFMISKEPSYKEKDDVAIIFETDKYAKELAMWSKMLDEIEDEIDDIRYRLYHDWIAYRNAIYLFEHEAVEWSAAKAFCKKEKAEMITIENAEEEDFLEKQLLGRHSRYWLGLKKESSNWLWDVDSTILKKGYWAEREPSWDIGATKEKPYCARAIPDCKNGRACWESALCSTKARPLCKMKPQKKWMTP